jgi:hypothetical protein
MSTLQAQASAVERAALNLNGHVNNLSELVQKGRRPPAELDLARAWLPDLKAAAATMRTLADQKEPTS